MANTKYNRRKQYYSSQRPETNRFQKNLNQSGVYESRNEVARLNEEKSKVFKDLNNPYVNDIDYVELSDKYDSLARKVNQLSHDNIVLIQMCSRLAEPDKKRNVRFKNDI